MLPGSMACTWKDELSDCSMRPSAAMFEARQKAGSCTKMDKVIKTTLATFLMVNNDLPEPSIE
jgi:hypothetical protein